RADTIECYMCRDTCVVKVSAKGGYHLLAFKKKTVNKMSVTMNTHTCRDYSMASEDTLAPPPLDLCHFHLFPKCKTSVSLTPVACLSPTETLCVHGNNLVVHTRHSDGTDGVEKLPNVPIPPVLVGGMDEREGTWVPMAHMIRVIGSVLCGVWCLKRRFGHVVYSIWMMHLDTLEWKQLDMPHCQNDRDPIIASATAFEDRFLVFCHFSSSTPSAVVSIDLETGQNTFLPALPPFRRYRGLAADGYAVRLFAGDESYTHVIKYSGMDSAAWETDTLDGIPVYQSATTLELAYMDFGQQRERERVQIQIRTRDPSEYGAEAIHIGPRHILLRHGHCPVGSVPDDSGTYLYSHDK
ncbi:hypothetical protein KIPB_010025, partial [Kipferlia bialata]